jgi:aminopeptidase N
VTIIAGKEDAKHLLSNGNFLGGGNYDEGRHFAAWFDPHPKPSYLFALVGGDLGLVEDSFTTMSGREVALKIYVEHGKEGRARLCDGCAQALHEVGRRGLWPRI